MNLYELLKELEIYFEEIEHEAVFTVSEAEKLKEQIVGVGCKNLFLKDKRSNYYLYVLRNGKKADLKGLSTILKVGHLTFASLEELSTILKLRGGSVTPLGIIHDREHKTLVILDKELIGNKLLVHPNTNTKTMAILYEDLIRFIEFVGNQYVVI